MPLPIERRIYPLEGYASTILERVKGNDAALITQASLTAVTYTTYDLSTGLQVETGTVTISAAVSDTLQTGDSRWEDEAVKGDTEGFNFEFSVPGTAWPIGGRDYRLKFNFDPVTGDDFAVIFRVTARQTDGD